MSKGLVTAILNRDYDLAKEIVAKAVQENVFPIGEQDAQSVAGNPVTSVDLPGSPPETDGDNVGAGEGVPADYEGKGTPEITGKGAAPVAAGDDPGSTPLDDGGTDEREPDYGPAVVHEAEKEDEKGMGDDDDEDEDKKDKKEDE